MVAKEILQNMEGTIHTGHIEQSYLGNHCEEANSEALSIVLEEAMLLCPSSQASHVISCDDMLCIVTHTHKDMLVKVKIKSFQNQMSYSPMT